MTPDEAIELYNIEVDNHNEYCDYIRSYSNKIDELRSERQRKCMQAEDKQREIQRNQELFDSINNTTGDRDGLFSHLNKINEKVQEAASNFSSMVSSSAVKAFNLSNEFGENATNANSKLTEVFDLIGKGKSAISGTIENLNQELQALNSRIQELDSEICRAQGMIDQYESDKQRCLANMAYYDRFI